MVSSESGAPLWWIRWDSSNWQFAGKQMVYLPAFITSLWPTEDGVRERRGPPLAPENKRKKRKIGHSRWDVAREDGFLVASWTGISSTANGQVCQFRGASSGVGCDAWVLSELLKTRVIFLTHESCFFSLLIHSLIYPHTQQSLASCPKGRMENKLRLLCNCYSECIWRKIATSQPGSSLKIKTSLRGAESGWTLREWIPAHSKWLPLRFRWLKNPCLLVSW